MSISNYDKRTIAISIIAMMLSLLSLTGCPDDDTKTKNVQAEKAKAAANAIVFTENAEIDNIKKRLELTANPGLLGYIVLINGTGQVVMYTGVQGKVTSGGKRLTPTDRYDSEGGNYFMRPAPSDEGTYGSSGEYVFFWTPAGQYIQWSGTYLYSDKPFRLSTEPIAIAITEPGK
jgi:hypothetical protein